MKKTHGITLIALIITIIVMLILVSVSVNIVLKTGLFKSAGDATKNWKSEQDKETNMSEITIDGKTYASVEDYINGKEKEIHNWTRTGDTLNCKCEQCTNKGTKDEGRTLTIGQRLDYHSSIDNEEGTKWVVLGIEDSNKNKTNETLLLTTEEPSKETLKLYVVNALAYNMCLTEISKKCKELYGNEARGMTIEDVNNCLQYIPTGGMYYSNNTWNTAANLTTKLSELGDAWEKIKNHSFYPSRFVEDKEKSLGDYVLNGYYYAVDSTVSEVFPVLPSSTSTIAKSLIFGESSSYEYWLASRGVSVHSVGAYFGPGTVEEGLVSLPKNLYDSRGDAQNYGRDGFCLIHIRAIVSLKNDIPKEI